MPRRKKLTRSAPGNTTPASISLATTQRNHYESSSTPPSKTTATNSPKPRTTIGSWPTNGWQPSSKPRVMTTATSSAKHPATATAVSSNTPSPIHWSGLGKDTAHRKPYCCKRSAANFRGSKAAPKVALRSFSEGGPPSKHTPPLRNTILTRQQNGSV